MTYTMKVICAWCKKHLYDVESETPGTSHGMCEDCQKKWIEQSRKTVEEMKGKGAPQWPSK